MVRQERDLLLGLLALGDVEHHALHEQRLIGLVVDHDGAIAEPQHAAVASDEAILQRERFARGSSLEVGGERLVPVLRVQVGDPHVRIVHVLLGRDAQERFDLRTDVTRRHAFVGEVHIDDRGDLLDEHAVLRPGFLQLPLGPNDVGDVEHQAEPELRDTVFIVHEDRFFADPHLVTVAMDRAVLLAERLAGRDGSFARLSDPLQVVGMQHIAPSLGRGEPLLAGHAQQLEDAGTDVDHRVALVDAVDVQDGGQTVDDAAVASLELPVSPGEVRCGVGAGRADLGQEAALGGQGVDARGLVVVNHHVATYFEVVLPRISAIHVRVLNVRGSLDLSGEVGGTSRGRLPPIAQQPDSSGRRGRNHSA